MSHRYLVPVLFFVSLTSTAFGQEAVSGISIPVTISGNARYTGSSEDSGNSPLNGGFRALLSPRLQLGQHWFAYGVLGAESANYWPYAQGWDNDNPVRFDLLQAYLGYEKQIGSATILVKGGRLSSAFGRFPLEYDDAKTSLILPPAGFIVNLPLRPDQLPCGVKDIIWRDYDGPVSFGCGGSTAERYGITPVSLYGIPGVETQLSWGRVDARLQMTNSSPANPQSLLSSSQSPQATVGAGYSLKTGLHIGASAFRGPWLESNLQSAIPGTDLDKFNASGVGVDAQWLSGHWAVQGEWHRVHFSLPGFVGSPSSQDAYAEVRRIISPRTYVAFRSSFLIPGEAVDATHSSTPQIDSHQQVYETVFGYRINRLQLLKMGFVYSDRNEWTLGHGYWPQERTWTLECQLVTSFSALSKAFR